MRHQFSISFLFEYGYLKFRREKINMNPRGLILKPYWPMVELHISCKSQFCKACSNVGYLTLGQLVRAVMRYQLGMSLDGGVIFWQMLSENSVYDGKIMYYKPDCHRNHDHHPTWVTSILKQYCSCSLDVDIPRCLFGTHLLWERPADTPVAIVEAEKTAVVMSELFPDYIWVAPGGLEALKPQSLLPLKGRRVILFPDTDPDGKTFAKWFDVAKQGEKVIGRPIMVSPLLEREASEDQKRRKIDILDYVFEKRGEKY